MKKIKSLNVNLGNAQSLTRQQLKKVMGGVATTYSGCNATCCDGSSYQYSGPSPEDSTANLCGGWNNVYSMSCS